MALTRPRYSQIPDSDYKNSCRIVTTTDVTLTSGAPLTYDGVTLVQYDRVLVAGQTDKTQNGIYSVSTLGSGSNGTWVRSKDANTNDRLTAGMNTFIEEGTYTGQFWHLLTPNPIVLGVTELIFGQITGNAAGTSSQVQYNSSGSVAGAANLRYDSVTGNVLVGGGTVSTSNVTGALTVNGGIGVTGQIWASGNIYSVGSRVLTAYDLQTVTFTANYISKDPANVAVPVVGTGTIYGTHNFGNLAAISTYGDYNTTAESGYYSVNDATGAPGFIVYVGFTGVTSFNRALYNINYTQTSGHTVTLDFYNYDTDLWDSFAQYSGSGSWQSFTLGVIDANPYIDAAGNVTTRIYHVSSGSTSHRTWIDYVALEQSITGGQGPRGATGPTGPSGTYSGGYISGIIITGNNIVTSGNFISNSSNVSVSTTTGALVLTGNGGAGIGGNVNVGGNVTANAFYTLNGLFWSSNGLAFSSGLEVSEINTANALSNISTQVTSLRFDRDTGMYVNELSPGNVRVSLGSTFKTWHVPGQTDLVAVAEDEVTFFGNGIDITTHATYPKSITFIANNSVLEANVGAYHTWANGQITGLTSEIGSLSTFATSNASAQAASIDAIAANLTAFELYANTKIGTNNNSNLVIQSTTDSVSAETGALVVAGGAGIAGNLYVAGNIFASNLISIGTTTLSVTDPLLYLTASNPSPYNYDIGFYSHFVGGSPTSHYQHTGLARNYTNGVWGFFSNIRPEPGATIAWSNVDIIYDTVQVGDIIVANTTAATSTTTGALTVAGGAGIAGALYVTNIGEVSANIGSVFTHLNTLDANVAAYQSYANDYLTQLDANIVNYSTYANTYLGTATTFNITDSGSSSYVINSETNPPLYLIRGQKYNFSVNATSNPFWIKTAPSIGSGDQYNTGVTNNGAANGIIAFEVPLTAPDVLYYVSQFDSAMTNQLKIVNFTTLDANIGTLFLGNASTQANIGAFQTSIEANIGTLFLGNASTQANLGAFQIYANANIGTASVNFAEFAAYANTKIGTNNNGNLVINATTASTDSTTGALVVKGGVGIAGTTYGDKFYTTAGVFWAGNSNPYSTGGIGFTASTTAPVSPSVGDKWYDTVDGILFEYVNDGDSYQWVDLTSPTFSAASPIAYDTDVTFGSNVAVQGNIFITDGIFWSVNNTAYSTGGGGSFSGSDDVLRANVGAYQIYANANIGTLYLGNISTQANLGAYQLYANANLGSQENSINSINSLRLAFNTYANANIGAYQTWANSTFSTSTYSNTNVIAYLTQGATIGSGSTTSNLVAAATTTSSSTTTGALVVKGGAGVAGAINVGSSGTFAGLIQTTATTAATSTGTGALYVAGGAGIVGNLYAGGNVILGSATTSTNVVVTGTRTSTSTTTGALVVRGGTGIAGAIYGGSTLITSGNIVAGSGIGTTNTTTGALVVVGGAGISGDLRVGNDSYVNNNLSVTQSAYIGEVALSSGTASTNTSTGALRVTGGAGVGGSVHANRLYTVQGLYWSGNGNPLSVEASNIFGSNLVAASGTTSTSINTGALVVVGGAGVSGDLNVTAGSTVTGWSVGGLLWASCSAPATSSTSGGGFLVDGGARLLGNVYASGNVILGANTSSNVVANATTTSTSTTTGALVVKGGAGIGGNLYVGSEFVVPGGGKVTSSGLANFFEKANVVASTPPSVVNVDLSTVSVMYWTSNATANITANIRGDANTPLNSILSIGQSVTTALFIPNGASNYYINTIKIDNTTVTAAYSGSSAPSLGNSNSIDIYSFTILKTADATYKVFASQAQFMHPG